MTMQSTTTSASLRPPPPRMTVGFYGWLRANLFSSILDGIITVVLTILLALAVVNLLSWIIVTADWTVVTSRLPLYVVGRYPQEFYWRPELSLILFSTLIGIAAGMWRGIAIVFAIMLAIITLTAAIAPNVATAITTAEDATYPPISVSILMAFNTVAIIAGYFAAGIPAIGRPKTFFIATLAVFIISLLLVIGVPGIPTLEPVNTQDIGGLTLNLLLAVFGIVCSFPIGVMLALGRRSRLPFIKIFCVGFIELVRGVPLITLLFMSRHILPLTFPESISIDELYLAAITITLFSSAYMAENVRGGMAAVPPGQNEAGKALGLRDWQTTIFITLPQGIRNIIPAIVGQSIGLFKDTSLVFIIGMLDLVEIGRVTIQGNIEFVDNGREVYLFIALIFWIFTFSMSYVSRKIEAALGVGHR